MDTALPNPPSLEDRLHTLEGQMLLAPAQVAAELRAVLTQAQEQKDTLAQAKALVLLGGCAFAEGKLHEIEICNQQALPLLTAAGDLKWQARCLNGLGLAAQARGIYFRAAEYFRQSLELSRSLQDPVGIVRVLNNMALISCRIGDNQRATEYLCEAQELLLRTRHPNLTFTIAIDLILLYIALKEYARALATTRLYLALAEEEGRVAYIVSLSSALALCLMQQGNMEQAQHHAQRAARILQTDIKLDFSGAVHKVLGQTYTLMGEDELAETYLQQAAQLARASRSLDTLKATLHELTKLYRERGDFERAYEESWNYFAVHEQLFPSKMSFEQLG